MNMTALPIDEHAAAVTNITKLVTDLQEAQAVILQLRADKHQVEDRLEMTVEDRDFWRDQANGFRSLLTELATRQDTINRETETARAIVATINEAIKPPRAETHALAALEAEFNKGNANEAAGD